MKVPKVLDNETINKEIDELINRGFDISKINLILSIEKTINRYISPSLSQNISVDNLQKVKRMLNEEKLYFANIANVLYALKCNVDLDKINFTDKDTNKVRQKIDAILCDIDIDTFPVHCLDSLCKLKRQGMDINLLKDCDEQVLSFLFYILSGHHGKENVKAIIENKFFNFQKLRALDNKNYLRTHKINNLLLNDNLSPTKISILSDFYYKYSSIDIGDIIECNVSDEARLNVLLQAKIEKVDMSDFLDNKYSAAQLYCIFNAKKHNFNYEYFLNKEFGKERLFYILETLKTDNEKFDLSPLLNVDLNFDIAKAMYILGRAGYTVSKNYSLEEERC